MDECPTLPFDMPALPERWHPVAGYEGLYEVSDLGHVRSCPRRAGGRPRDPQRLLAITINPRTHYRQVSLWKNNKGATLTVHKVVARAFLGARPKGLHALHGDGDKSNNAAANLRYGTRSENMLDSVRHGTHRFSRDHCEQGHKYTPDNTVLRSDGGRRCLICKRGFAREAQRRRRARLKAAAAA